MKRAGGVGGAATAPSRRDVSLNRVIIRRPSPDVHDALAGSVESNGTSEAPARHIEEDAAC
jgi:hypothetical protein